MDHVHVTAPLETTVRAAELTVAPAGRERNARSAERDVRRAERAAPARPAPARSAPGVPYR